MEKVTIIIACLPGKSIDTGAKGCGELLHFTKYLYKCLPIPVCRSVPLELVGAAILNHGIVATGNYLILDSLRGAPHPRDFVKQNHIVARR